MPRPAPGRDEKGVTPRPSFDPSSAAFLGALPIQPLTPEGIEIQRSFKLDTVESLRERFGFDHSEDSFAAPDGTELKAAIFNAPATLGSKVVPGPLFIFIHGGGMVAGTELELGLVLPNLAAHGGVLVSLRYRLAPEHPAPIPLEDCYAGYLWAVASAERLGADPSRIILIGGSAGAGLAAGVALLARDRGGPRILAVQLDCPMLDDRCDTVSHHQFDALGSWSRQSSLTGWGALLGDSRGGPDVSPYVAPARATWLGDLPPILITISSADPFRDEDVAFASAIWRDGGDCELHVTPGGMHGHEGLASAASIGQAYARTAGAWVERQLHPDGDAVTSAVLDALMARLAARV